MLHCTQSGAQTRLSGSVSTTLAQTETSVPCKCAICGYENGITDDFTKWPDIPGLHTVFYPVTKDGKPTGEVLNLICARCLGNANTMRLFVKAMMSGVQITDHAVSRFIERTAADIPDKQTGRVAVLRAFSKARKIRFQRGYMVRRIMSNDFTEADYYWGSDLVFVVTRAEPQTIVTVEKLWGKSLNRDFFLADGAD